MFPFDDDIPPPPRVRYCPDCRVELRTTHSGVYASIFVCPKCGVTLTVPPKHTQIER